ncbi:hypothetical protein HMPREF9248_0170 [Fannyhessea vaginae PB189-T1-4]|uniref:Uncharacterized protein n=1 Tax=Fannyhessea vaginae PB189-T1-4 TaxID=866774 RepID=A0ABP2IXC5_9ACTN|nr:hypothetical protein HMPREF9248_0170 [Fannyhessea vaginae PB189-T1-4]
MYTNYDKTLKQPSIMLYENLRDRKKAQDNAKPERYRSVIGAR